MASLSDTSNRDILIVFDIDETLIQFINKGPYPFWTQFQSEGSIGDKCRFGRSIKYTDYPDKNQVILFRPGLEEFLKMAKESGRIKVAIWTYSEQSYAVRIAREICEKFNLPSDTFIFTYGTEDIRDHDIPKSLEQIWSDPNFGSKFNKFNTFLVDDRFGNVCHEINNRNSILIQAFAPFGEDKKREPMSQELLTKSVNDHLFCDLTEISQKILDDIDGCDDNDIREAFKSESVFAPKCMKRRGLSEYVKIYNEGLQLCTIGEVENAAAPGKGGRRTRKMRNYNKTRRSKGGKKGKKSMQRIIKNIKSKRYHRR
jgi:hypothetical protein